MMNRFIAFIILLSAPAIAMGQSERSDIRHGNKLYEQGKFAQSEKSYQSALSKNGSSIEAAFNLGASLYKQGRWAEAAQSYAALGEQGGAATAFNLANACFQQRNEQGKLDEAIEHYKESLRLNPSDMEAKFNLAYAQKLKKDQQGGGDQNDQNKDKDQDQNKDQQDQKQDQNKNDDQNKDQDKQDRNQEQPKPQSKQDAERMLNAIQAAENKTKEKVDAEKVKGVGTSRSSKDW